MYRPLLIFFVVLAAALICTGSMPSKSEVYGSKAVKAALPTPVPLDGDNPFSMIKMEQVGSNFKIWFQNTHASGTTGSTGGESEGTTGAFTNIIGTTSGDAGYGETRYFIGVASDESYTISNVDRESWSMSSPKLVAASTPVSVYGVEAQPGERVTLTCDASITSLPLHIVVDKEDIMYPPDDLTPVVVQHHVSEISPSGTLYRFGATSASVDSRKMYGVPNKLGQSVGLDPNSPSRPVNFSSWDYKGGLFTGYMDATTLDQSGSSRIQIYGTSPPTITNGVAGDLVVNVLGNSRYGGVSDISIYGVSTSDPYYSQARSTVTWDTKWTVFDSTVGSLGHAPSAGLQNFYFTATSSFPTKYVLVSANETAAVTGWTYYASATYAASHPELVDPLAHLFVFDNPPPFRAVYEYTDSKI